MTRFRICACGSCVLLLPSFDRSFVVVFKFIVVVLQVIQVANNDRDKLQHGRLPHRRRRSL